MKTKIKNLLNEHLSNKISKEHTDDEIVDYNKIELQYEYDKLNDLLFKGNLQPITMLWNKKKGAHGVVKGTRNKRTGKVTINSLSMSKFLSVPYKFFKNVLAHEMIHVFWMQQDVDAKHGPLFVQQMNRINSMGLGFNVSVTTDSSEISKFQISSDVVKKGIELVFLLSETDKEDNLLSVMKYGTYKSLAYKIADIYKYFIVDKPKHKTAMGEFYLSTNPNLQTRTIQRAFNGGFGYIKIDKELAETFKSDAKFLSKFEVLNGNVVWIGPDQPNRTY